MDWYLASLQMLPALKAASVQEARRCRYLLTASNHDEAYRRSTELGNKKASEIYKFIGINDLLLVHEVPEDGSELSWSQIEITHEELVREICPEERMRAFRKTGPSPSGWYVGSVVICEVHDEGSHGELVLVWINSYLIAAKDAEASYSRAIQIGQGQEDGPGSHRCDGQRAHWEFRGIKNIIPIHEKPSDGSLLWCDDFEVVAEQLSDLVPKKSDLSLFKWAAQQGQASL